MASVLAELVISGSRKSDGSANDSGTVYAYIPGTTTPVNLYTDSDLTAIATQPIVLDEGGRIPATDYPDGLWVTRPVRLLIQDSETAVVSDTTYYPATANNVSVDNEGFTSDTMDGVLDAAHDSFGGTDFTYLESAGATERTVHDKFQEQGVWVTDFGAIGDGVFICTTAFQAAINRAKVLGTNVLVPDGSFITDQALTASSVTGMRIIGAGKTATTIRPTHATANCFTFSTSTSCSVEGMTIDHSATSTGACIYLSDGIDFTVKDVDMAAGFAYGVDHTGQTNSFINYSTIVGSSRAIRYGSAITAAGRPTVVSDSVLIASAATVIEYDGSITDAHVTRCAFNGTTGILFNAALTGLYFTVTSCPTLGTITSTAFDLSGLATDPKLRQWGNVVDGYVVTQASGGGGGSNHTPNRARGSEVHVRLTSGGAAVCTINAATPAPGSNMRNTRLTLRLTAAAGGNITWTFPAVYVLVGGGTTVTGTDGNTDVIEFQWDTQTSEWRECFRSATAT